MIKSDWSQIRVGHGFDVHRWSDDPNRVLVLGGIEFPDTPGLVGHSDADVVMHSCIDAILGATGLGDIGTMFPDSSVEWKDANSGWLLRQTMNYVTEQGWSVGNIDCTIICDQPKLAPHRQQMQDNISEIVAAPVMVKGKRTEGVAGLSGGIQGHAVSVMFGTKRTS